MDQIDKDNIRKPTAHHQRRTQSVDEYSLQTLNDGFYTKSNEHINGISTNGNHQIIQGDDDYICAPLPRMNSRPSARTCWRARSVFAPSPKCNFGPKGTLRKVQNNDQLIVIQDPSSQRLQWISTPNHIFIIRKPGHSTLPEFRTLVLNLLKRGVKVYIELLDRQHLPFETHPDLIEHGERCIAFNQENHLSIIDLLICLGGDGTLLHASSMFQKSCPPILSFSMGSLGFLTPFDFKSHDKTLNEVLSGNVSVLLRTRLSCKIVREGSENSLSPDTPQLRLPTDVKIKVEEREGSNQDDDSNYLALNEVVIDRGPNSYLSNLDLYINDRFITKVQGDGLIISTPTGSTAYGMAAGANMVHPNVPAIVICPICPHSLSFRPIVVPAGIELKVKVSEDTRLSAWLSVDGRNRLELHQQDSIHITTSVYPVPSICRFDQLGDWFESLAGILHWNERKTQSRLDSDHETEQDERSPTPDEESSLSENQKFSAIESPTEANF